MAIRGMDLTQRPPRSPRVRLGGFVILPRMLDKGRPLLMGKASLTGISEFLQILVGVDAAAVTVGPNRLDGITANAPELM